MLALQYPPSWLFVDDEERFLESITSLVHRSIPVLATTRPDNVPALLALDARPQTSTNQPGEDIRIERRISVIVVDYAMPRMNGLQLLEQLGDHGMMSILLTGVADEAVAIDALNEKRIDRYVKKSDPDAIQRVLKYCTELDSDFMSRYSGRVALDKNWHSEGLRSFVVNENANESTIQYLPGYEVLRVSKSDGRVEIHRVLSDAELRVLTNKQKSDGESVRSVRSSSLRTRFPLDKNGS